MLSKSGIVSLRVVSSVCRIDNCERNCVRSKRAERIQLLKPAWGGQVHAAAHADHVRLSGTNLRSSDRFADRVDALS